jgi:inhibitor of cysteine peptidase
MPKTYTRDHPSIGVKTGDQFVIELPSNPTTGYQWQPAFDPAALGLLGRDFSLPGTAMGGGGVERFCFEARAAGVSRLSFAYERAWEPGVRDQAQFEVKAA